MYTRPAHTLIELVVVLALLVAVSGVLVPLFSGTIHNAHHVATEQSLRQVRDALIHYWLDTKHVALDGVTTVATNADRLNVDWLFANPVTGDDTFDFDLNTLIGWRGPYLAESTGNLLLSGSPFLIDAWNNEIEIQDVDPLLSARDVRIVSGGPDGTITIPSATATTALTDTEIGDDIYVALQLR